MSVAIETGGGSRGLKLSKLKNERWLRVFADAPEVSRSCLF